MNLLLRPIVRAPIRGGSTKRNSPWLSFPKPTEPPKPLRRNDDDDVLLLISL